jgi:hypothetical protein
MADTLAGTLRDELTLLLAPLATLRTPDGVRAMLQSFGHGQALAGQATLQAALDQCAALIDELQQIDDAALATWEGAGRALQAASDVFAAVRAVERAVTDPALAGQAKNLGQQLVNRLAVLYLRARWPQVHRAGAALTLITPAELTPPSPLVLSGGQIARLPWRDDVLRFDRFGDLLARPWPTLADFYLPNALARATDAHNAAERLFPLIAMAASSLDLGSFRELRSLDPPAPPAPPVMGDVIDHAGGSDSAIDVTVSPDPAIDTTVFLRRRLPRLVILLPGLDNRSARLGVAFTISSAEHDGGVAGVIATLAGDLSWSETRGPWQLTFSSDGEIPAFVFGPNGFALAPSSTPVTGATGRLGVTRVTAGGTAWVLGSADGSRLELGNVRVGVDFSLTPARRALAFTIDVDRAKLVIAPGDGDGLLRTIMPPEGAQILCNVGVMLSSDRGLDIGVTVQGSGSLSGTTPIGKSIGPLRIDALTRDFRPVDTDRGSGLAAAVGVRLSLQLGPVVLSLDGPSVGADLLWTLKDPARVPNLGVLHVDRLGLRAPTGAGLAIDGALIQGAGSLQYDAARQQYSGALELAVRSSFVLEVAGVLTTRMPDGSDGFSLLLLGALRFPPIPVGFGFSLDELGALVGVNRTANVDALIGALAAGDLGAVLFPGNPAAMASLSDTLGKLFPAKRDVHTIGILAGFSWGRGPLARIELGFIYDTSAPHRIIAIGRLSIERPQIAVHVLALGILDFDLGELDLQARLVDSRILGGDLSGDAAIMLRWGSNPSFVLSIGGFHPAFHPPTEFTRRFPPLRRVTVRAHTDESVLRLSLQAYVAVTSCTVQMGARVDFGVTVSAFSVDGMVSFDALIQFDPRLYIDVMVRGSVAVKAAGVTLIGASVGAQLIGPGDWYANGTATISVLWWDLDFDFTIGEEPAAPSLPPVDGASQLAAALADARNWGTQVAAGGNGLVSVRRRNTPGGPLLFHPLDELAVRQQIVPLGLVVDRIEAGPLAAPRTFEVSVKVGGKPAGTSPVSDAFARAKYVDMSEAARLSAPSFELMPSGVRVALDSPAAPAPSVTATWDYDEFVWTKQGLRTPTVRPFVPDIATIAHTLTTSAAADAPLRRAGVARYRAA